MASKKQSGPKILVFDIETSPILAWVWDLWDQNIALNQIEKDWEVLSWSAKWLGDSPKKIMYQDRRKAKNDKELLKGIHSLLNEADIVVTQNGKRFDSKKLNARFILNGMKPPSNYKHIDTCEIAKNKFGFTSNKLEYLSDKLCKKYKKSKHKKFPGMELWTQCLAGNKEAWNEMESYNKFDILSLEELYTVISPWDNKINFNLYRLDDEIICNCGSDNFQKRGYAYTTTGKFQRFQCIDCGSWSRGSENLLTKDKRKSLRRTT